MADIKFSCPSCNQEIECDELWSGHDLACPTCQAQITVPQVQAGGAPKPAIPAGPVAVPTGANPRLSIGAGKASEYAAAAKSGTLAGRPGTQKPAPKKSSGGKGAAMKWVKIAAVVVILAAGGYFGWPYIKGLQDKTSKKLDESAKNSDGGEVGHIAALNNVLDATDPSRMGSMPSSRGGGSKAMALAAAQAAAAGGANAAGGGATTTNVFQDPAGAAPVWSLELSLAKIPDGGANGSISGAPFVVQTARIDPIGTAHVLSLRQGVAPAIDREVIIYLHLGPGETLGGHHWLVSQDLRPPAAPQIVKRWKTDPKYAPQQASYPGGYAMKLDLGTNTDNVITGRIYLALPDQQQSVVAGTFKAVIGAPVPVAQQAVAPTAAPVAPAMSRDASFNSRYGIKK